MSLFTQTHQSPPNKMKASLLFTLMVMAMAMDVSGQDSMKTSSSSPVIKALKKKVEDSSPPQLPSNILLDRVEKSKGISIRYAFICNNPTMNCDGNGVCISTNGTVNVDCKCYTGYITIECDPNIRCFYNQEKRIKEFLLSFFSWDGRNPHILLSDPLVRIYPFC